MIKCANCKYFMLHFRSYEGRVFMLHNGFCDKLSKSVARKEERTCECFESFTPTKIKKENIYYLEKTLENIQKQLCDINMYINRYNKPSE